MPVETLVVLAVVIAMFASFMVVLGSVWIWTNLPDRPQRRAVRSRAVLARQRP